ncbi:MAG: carboxy-S-adenosyl-L-methionine synthase CmoA [Wolinella sp.]
MRDELFNEKLVKQFEFDERVAGVFDDMLLRSIPCYATALGLSADFAILNTAEAGGVIYDLGCSTGTLLLEIERRHCNAGLKLIGIDSSKAMIERAQNKANGYGSKVEFIEGDILGFEYQKCDVIMCHYTIQFIRPMNRIALLRRLFDALKSGGILILSEKVISEERRLDRQMIERYYEYKRAQGYSEVEIIKKREALENVLVPYSARENEEMLKEAGFSHVETIFRWVNFATFIATKAEKS